MAIPDRLFFRCLGSVVNPIIVDGNTISPLLPVPWECSQPYHRWWQYHIASSSGALGVLSTESLLMAIPYRLFFRCLWSVVNPVIVDGYTTSLLFPVPWECCQPSHCLWQYHIASSSGALGVLSTQSLLMAIPDRLFFRCLGSVVNPIIVDGYTTSPLLPVPWECCPLNHCWWLYHTASSSDALAVLSTQSLLMAIPHHFFFRCLGSVVNPVIVDGYTTSLLLLVPWECCQPNHCWRLYHIASSSGALGVLSTQSLLMAIPHRFFFWCLGSVVNPIIVDGYTTSPLLPVPWGCCQPNHCWWLYHIASSSGALGVLSTQSLLMAIPHRQGHTNEHNSRFLL